MKKLSVIVVSIFVFLFSAPIFCACARNNTIKMYNIESKSIESLNFEDYIAGVVAGEMYNEWPEEALKAQCILARTFAVDFLQNKKSKYSGADISNDISEAQAYNKENINDKIKKAVSETSSLVIKYNDEYINAWFHSNSGGMTETANVGLNYTEENPAYIKNVKSPENNTNSENFSWSYSFSKSEILKALSSMGISVSNINNIKLGEKSSTGRSLNLLIGDKSVNANTFRLAIGSTKLKSTLIDSITINNDNIEFKGFGYGHGVGLSQWGAKILAEQGKDFNYIINYYFNNVKIVKI